MKRFELAKIRKEYYHKLGYSLCEWSNFDYTILNKIMYIKRAGKGAHDSYNDVIIMADTETSKKKATEYVYKNGKRSPVAYSNHVVAFTISIRAFNENIVTLYGHKPSEFIKTVNLILENMQGEKTVIYFHNYSYDYVFLRKFMFKEWGFPVKTLSTKPHFPIYMEFSNGLIIRDSLILAQTSLEKWAENLGVEHKKAMGKWDYDLFRNQDYIFNDDELEYIEHDTLAGVECIDTLMTALHKHIYSIPYTATGIPREEVRKRGAEFNAHEKFLNQAPSKQQNDKLQLIYHGGYTHSNRSLIGVIMGSKDNTVKCYDFASSYPFCLVARKYPCEKFMQTDNCSIDKILRNSEDYAFMFKLILVNVSVKSNVEMPVLQFSKCTRIVNEVSDNGRILSADLVMIYINEQDLKVINEQYTYEKHLCTEVEFARKKYLPRWFTDYVFELFEAKCKLKHSDKVLYNLSKSKLNSLYGMSVQKAIREIIEEVYSTGEYIISNSNPDEEYEKYLKNRNTILNYSIGVWCTSYALVNLHELGKCVDTWIYSDTDSCYGIGWNEEMVKAYNNKCIEELKANNYSGVEFEGKTYYLGVAEHEPFKDEYTEYVTLGAKRYCGRCVADNELHITVAGVPKKGYQCLNDDIRNFAKGTVFNGEITGKKTHLYMYVDDIYIDEKGNETGDSIDLSPCDYLLNEVENRSLEEIFSHDVTIQIYDEGEII